MQNKPHYRPKTAQIHLKFKNKNNKEKLYKYEQIFNK